MPMKPTGRLLMALRACALLATPLAAGHAAPLTLQDVDRAAAAANIDVALARGAVRGAEAGIRQADVAPNPTLSLNAVSIQPRRIGGSAIQDNTDSILRLDELFERGGKRRLRVAAARADLDAAQGGLGDAVRTRTQAAESAFFDLLAAQQRVALFERIGGTYARSVEIAERRLKAGDIAGGDLARQGVDLIRSQTQLARARSALRDAQLALGVLIGREGDAATLSATADWPAPADPNAGLPAETLAERRPDVIAANARAEAARQRLGLARSERVRDVSAGVQLENDTRGYGQTFGLGIAVPLFWGNRFTGDIEAAGVDVAQAESVAARARTVAAADIANARRAAAEAGERLRQIDGALLPQARRAAETAEFAYGRGALSLIDLLDARRTLESVELEALDARDDFATALSALRAAQTTDQPQADGGPTP